MAKKNKKSRKESIDKEKILEYMKGLNNELESLHQSRQIVASEAFPTDSSRQIEYPIEFVSSEALPIDSLRQTEYPIEFVSNETMPMDLSFLSPSNNIVVETSPFPEMILPSCEMMKDGGQCQRLKKQVKRQNKVIDVLLQNLES